MENNKTFIGYDPGAADGDFGTTVKGHIEENGTIVVDSVERHKTDMEKKNEPMRAIDVKAEVLRQAFKSILRHGKDDWSEEEVISELMRYFAEAEKRKEREVLEELKKAKDDLDRFQDSYKESWKDLGRMINERISELEK